MVGWQIQGVWLTVMADAICNGPRSTAWPPALPGQLPIVQHLMAKWTAGGKIGRESPTQLASPHNLPTLPQNTLISFLNPWSNSYPTPNSFSSLPLQVSHICHNYFRNEAGIREQISLSCPLPQALHWANHGSQRQGPSFTTQHHVPPGAEKEDASSSTTWQRPGWHK